MSSTIDALIELRSAVGDLHIALISLVQKADLDPEAYGNLLRRLDSVGTSLERSGAAIQAAQAQAKGGA